MLDAVLESLDGLDEKLAAEYTKDDDPDSSTHGKFVLQVKPRSGLGLENVAGLKSSLESARSERDAAKREAKEAQKGLDGIDLDEAKKALSIVKELGDKPVSEKKVQLQLDNLREELGTKHASELEKANKDRDGYKAQLRTVVISDRARAAIAKKKGNATLLLPHVERMAELRFDDDGNHRVVVLNAKGEPRISPATDNDGDMTIDELIDEMNDDPEFHGAFEGSGASGSGARGSKSSDSPGRTGAREVSKSEVAAGNVSIDDIAAGKVSVVD